jgi:hypothetical protein
LLNTNLRLALWLIDNNFRFSTFKVHGRLSIAFLDLHVRTRTGLLLHFYLGLGGLNLHLRLLRRLGDLNAGRGLIHLNLWLQHCNIDFGLRHPNDDLGLRNINGYSRGGLPHGDIRLWLPHSHLGLLLLNRDLRWGLLHLKCLRRLLDDDGRVRPGLAFLVSRLSGIGIEPH